MDDFPFMSRDQAIDELKRDAVYKKICEYEDEQGQLAIADKAWETGAQTAQKAWEKYGDNSFFKIASDLGVAVEHVHEDYILGGRRYFSEYYSGTDKRIKLYTLSIRKWAQKHDLEREEAEELILAHELYHHYECTELGLTSKQYLVHILRIGKFCFGKTGVRALSEIGACAFARTYYELLGWDKHEPPTDP